METILLSSNGWNFQFCHSSSWCLLGGEISIAHRLFDRAYSWMRYMYKDWRNEKSTVRSSSKLSVGFKNGTGILLETIMPYICHKRTLICNCNNHLTKLKGLAITFETWPSS